MIGKKFLMILGLLLVLLVGTVSGVMADTGKLVDENTVIVNQSGENVSYEAICIDKEQTITIGQTKPVSNNITVREGVVDYIVNNYHNTSKADLQDGVWNITENNSIPFVEYPDFYSAQKKIETEKITTIEEVNGSNYTVTRWDSESWDFIFRMMGDGHGIGFQDLLIYNVTYLFENNEIFELIVPEVPDNETNITNETPETPETNPSIEIICEPIFEEDLTSEEISRKTNHTVEEPQAAMKETGVPTVTIGLAILAIVLLVGIGIYSFRNRKD